MGVFNTKENYNENYYNGEHREAPRPNKASCDNFCFGKFFNNNNNVDNNSNNNSQYLASPSGTYQNRNMSNENVPNNEYNINSNLYNNYPQVQSNLNEKINETTASFNSNFSNDYRNYHMKNNKNISFENEYTRGNSNIQNNNIYNNYGYNTNRMTNNGKILRISAVEARPKLNIILGSYSLNGTDMYREPKINQDAYIIKELQYEDTSYYILGVFDGHGECGEKVSQTIRYLIEQMDDSNFFDIEKTRNCIKKISRYIEKNPNIESYRSGSTLNLLQIIDDKIITANVGDSKAILIDKSFKYIELTKDHKPIDPNEKYRIENSGGRVDQCFGMGPFRVFALNSDLPGLAMSRSIGDGMAHTCGVIDEPDIIEYEISDINPLAIVIGSDGIFDFLKNTYILNIVSKYSKMGNDPTCANKCAEELCQWARKLWEESDLAIDDITCIVAFFF